MGAEPRRSGSHLFKALQSALTDLGRGKKKRIAPCLLAGAVARGDGGQINTEGPRLSFQKVKS